MPSRGCVALFVASLSAAIPRAAASQAISLADAVAHAKVDSSFPSGAALTLNDAIKLALANSPDLQPAEDRVELAGIQRRVAESVFGGIAKGFAVEVAANALRRHGLGGFIDAGGNQYLLGTPPGEPTWTVGVKDPDRPDRLLGVIETPETSVSTSAGYATFVEINGRKYGHILDPHTLQPSAAALSVTILSRDGTMADAYSKAAFILGPTAGLALIDSVPGTSGLIAYRKPDGGMGIVTSKRLGNAFRPAKTRD